MKSSAKPASGSGIFGSRDRVRGHEMHVRRQMRCHIVHDLRLDGSDVGNDGAGTQMRGDLAGRRAALADRNADDDEVGAFDRCGIGVNDLVGDAQFHDAPARRRRSRGGDDAAGQVLCSRGARDR